MGTDAPDGPATPGAAAGARSTGDNMPHILTRHPWLLVVGGAILLSLGLPYLPGELSSGVPPLPQVGALITVLVPLGLIGFGRRRRSLVGGFLLLVVGLGLGLFVLLRVQADIASFSDVVILLPVAALVTLSGLAALVVRWIVTAVRRRRDGRTHPRDEPAVPAPTPQPATPKCQPASHGPEQAGARR